MAAMMLFAAMSGTARPPLPFCLAGQMAAADDGPGPNAGHFTLCRH
jgi:hypothetical protein